MRTVTQPIQPECKRSLRHRTAKALTEAIHTASSVPAHPNACWKTYSKSHIEFYLLRFVWFYSSIPTRQYWYIWYGMLDTVWSRHLALRGLFPINITFIRLWFPDFYWLVNTDSPSSLLLLMPRGGISSFAHEQFLTERKKRGTGGNSPTSMEGNMNVRHKTARIKMSYILIAKWCIIRPLLDFKHSLDMECPMRVGWQLSRNVLRSFSMFQPCLFWCLQ